MENKFLENDRLNDILEATENLIREKGPDKTTLKDIMKGPILQRGGIYHYISSKDELYGLLLQRSMTDINRNFIKETEKIGAGLEEPLQVIAQGLNVFFNQSTYIEEIFIYLLAKIKDEKIKEILSQVYDHTLNLAVSWINVGKDAGVIKETINPKDTAEFFITLTYGQMIKSLINPVDKEDNSKDSYLFMLNILKVN